MPVLLSGLRTEVQKGLTSAFDLRPGKGSLEAGLTATGLTGPQAWVEGKYRATENLGLFGRAFADRSDAGAMVGVQLRF